MTADYQINLPDIPYITKQDEAVPDKHRSSAAQSSTESDGDYEEDDPWTVTDFEDRSEPWKDLSTSGKVKRVVWNYICRQIFLLGFLYLFICSLEILTSAFRLLGGATAGKVFSDDEVLSNPVAGVVIGILSTVLVQSSSTTTSIIVAMVGAELLNVNNAIPIVMGANIGTSVTNTIVSIGQSADRNQLRRAFGGATVHDMFNWLSVVVLLPLELITGYLFKLSEAIVEAMNLSSETDSGASGVDILRALTKPFTKFIIKIDTGIIKKIVLNDTAPDTSLIKMQCKEEDGTSYPCKFMFMRVAGRWPDWVIGLILLFISLILLSTCLLLIIRILNNIFRGHIASVIRRFVNADIPGKCGKYGTGYLAILIGALMTMLVQSSSIFTSTLTPLVGLGVITIDRVYPLTLGANIGTTFTAILASLVHEKYGDSISKAMQISMCHLFFNISGIILWYPIPFMRRVPIFLAKRLGDTTAKYRWFSFCYLVIVFGVLPALIFGLSVAGWEWLAGIGVPVLVVIIFIVLINLIQHKRRRWLPNVLRTWEFLPRWCHSLQPFDRLITRCFRKCRCCESTLKEDAEVDNQTIEVEC